MSLQNLVDDYRKPWLNIRVNDLTVDGQLIYSNEQIITVSGVATDGANYTSVYDAVQAGKYNIFMIGNTTDTNNIILAEPNLTVLLKHGVIWTLTDNTITAPIAEYGITIYSNGYSRVNWTATVAKSLFNGVASTFVQLFNLDFYNLSTANNCNIANGIIQIYANNSEFTFPNFGNCGFPSTSYSIINDCFITLGGANCNLVLTGNNFFINNLNLNGACDTAVEIISIVDSKINGLLFDGLTTNCILNFRDCILSNFKNIGGNNVAIDFLSGSNIFSNSTLDNLVVSNQSLLNMSNIHIGTGNVDCNTAGAAGSSLHNITINNGYFELLNNTNSIKINNCQTNTQAAPQDNTFSANLSIISNCRFLNAVTIPGNNITINACTVGTTGSGTITDTSGNKNIITSCHTGAAIVSIGTTIAANNQTF